LRKSLIKKEHSAAYNAIKIVGKKGSRERPGRPNVVKPTARAISRLIAVKRIGLGIEFQKCLFSRRMKIEKIEKKNMTSKLKVWIC